MKRIALSCLLALVLLTLVLAAGRALSAPALQLTYGAKGIQQLTYGGVILENLAQYPSDTFHIWHMQLTGSSGSTIGGWGENNQGRTWDASTHTWIYQFAWGTISVQFSQSGSTLDMNVKEVNNANSGVIFDGATIYPLALHFPQLPVGFSRHVHALAYNTTGPSVTLASYGAAEVAVVDPDSASPLYSGFEPTSSSDISYTPVLSSTAMDSLASFEPHFSRPVGPGQTDTFTVSLRFATPSTPVSTLAADVYQHWAKIWPPKLNWSDRRIIGTVYLASSPGGGKGNTNGAGGYPNNPRRYFNDSRAADFDINTNAGLAQFQAKIIQQAQANVQNAQRMNAQGIVTWDLEGEQYAMSTSYVCQPDQIAQISPEMDSAILSGPYANTKLDDAYFSIMKNAGLKIGVCARPQHFTFNSDNTASQVFLPNAQVEAELLRKMQYAHQRWGATVFYVDSNVDQSGGTLDAAIFQQLADALPDSLIIPEESTPKYYAYTAPFRSFLFHGDLGTPSEVYNYYPRAFSANLVNDVSASALSQHVSQLTQSVKNGDILMGLTDWWQPNDATLVQIYQGAE